MSRHIASWIVLIAITLGMLTVSPLSAQTKKKKLRPKKIPTPSWQNPAEASKQTSTFDIQGEYTGENLGVQIATLPDGQFHVLSYEGGLPGDGWQGASPIKTAIQNTSDIKALTANLKKVSRQSSTMGLKAPENAIILFESPDKHAFENAKFLDDLLTVGCNTKDKFSDFKLHMEFRMPYKPGRMPSNQDRGNSGVYIFNRYEIQLLDSFGLDYVNPDNNQFPMLSLNTQWCGCFYKKKLARFNMSFPPLSWQTYDIDFTSPKFEDDKKISNAKVTVKHNGVLIHDNIELDKGTGNGGKRPEVSEEKIYFQNHGNDVRFRNIWIVRK